MSSFQKALAASLFIAVLAIGIPFVTAPGAMDTAIKVSMFLSLMWVAVVIFTLAKFKWRGLWCLIGAPLPGYWLSGLYLIASGCAHNIKNCP